MLLLESKLGFGFFPELTRFSDQKEYTSIQNFSNLFVPAS